MKNFKLSFALVIAIAAVGITLATQAKSIGVRAITDCFQTIDITNGAGSNAQLVVDLPKANVQSLISTRPYATAVSSAINPALCTGTAKFCCAVLTTTTDAAAPVVTIEGVTGKFKVLEANIRWKP